jgi:hypothetical protein
MWNFLMVVLVVVIESNAVMQQPREMLALTAARNNELWHAGRR